MPVISLQPRRSKNSWGSPTNGPAEDTDRSGGTYCRWASEDSGVDLGASDEDEREPYYVSVEDETGALAVQGFESGKTTLDEDEEERDIDVVDNLGDDAYFRDHGLSVRHGDRVFSTNASGNDGHPLSNRDKREIERRAADIIIGKLGEPENESVAEKAAECARTRRCSGTRYHACDLLEESEVARITSFAVENVDGTARPAGSETAAVCEYYLDNPDDSLETGSRARWPRVPEVRARSRSGGRGVSPPLERIPGNADERDPELGDDAFFEENFGEVWVLKNDTLLSVSYELDIDLPPEAPAI
ncbi:MAG: hypothetical protein H0V95_03060 [Actinobacteria bacterium]|nr:hypothetical protein [Actinomycetota bacterium]